MKNLSTTFFVIAIIVTTFSSCIKEEAPGFSGLGKKPIYKAISELDDITNLEPQIIQQSGPIFLRDSLFFMTEYKKGIHIYDIGDSIQIRNLTFIKIPAVTDFTVENNYLYADSWKDLVTIDISNIYKIKVLSRQTNVFEPLLYPTLYNGIFECVDESRGAVVGWENEFLQNVKCQTFN